MFYIILVLCLLTHKCFGGKEHHDFYTNATNVAFKNGIQKACNVAIQDVNKQFSLNKLNNEILSLMELLKPTDEEIRVREDLVKRFREAVAFINPGAIVEPHGSYVSGLYLPNADIDLQISNWTNKPGDRLVLKLIEYGIISEKETVVSKLRGFDVVKTRDVLTSIKLDISSFEDSLPRMHATMKYIELFPRVKPLFLLLKLMLKEKRLYRRADGGLKGPFLFWLLISFLKAHDSTQQNYGELLLEILDFYGNLNYFETGIRFVDKNTCYLNPFYQRKSFFFHPNCYDLPMVIPLSLNEFEERSLENVTKFPEVQQVFRVSRKRLLHSIHNNHTHILASIFHFNNIRK